MDRWEFDSTSFLDVAMFSGIIAYLFISIIVLSVIYYKHVRKGK